MGYTLDKPEQGKAGTKQPTFDKMTNVLLLLHCRPLIIVLCVNAFLVTSFIPTGVAGGGGGGGTSGRNNSDHLALLAVKSKITDDPTRVLTSWNSSVHFCKWVGVTCNPKHQRVTILDLSSRSLVGDLSPYIGNMSFLRQIKLFNNTFHGEIPQEIGRLFRLQVLALYTNSFSGEIPSNISQCSNLTVLDIESNRMVGEVPNELSYLSMLHTFSIGFNNFSGGVPSFLGNFTSLELLSLVGNRLMGRIPDVFGGLQSLTFLAFGGNRLSGEAPLSIYNLSSLTMFSLARNELHGTLPSDLFLSLPQLQLVQHYVTNFSGPIPSSIANASNCYSIDLSENNFSGQVPDSLGDLQLLQELFLEKNLLGGHRLNFLVSLTNCTSLEAVGLEYNQFGGMLPVFSSNLSTNLQYLGLVGNKISGAIPPQIMNLANLTTLDLSMNRLTGRIPLEIGNLPMLQRLLLSSNKFSGKIPTSIGNLSSLASLKLQDNQLDGAIPSSLGALKRLLSLDLSKNNLSDTIPGQLFTIPTLAILLNLAKNHLVGPLPQSVGNLTDLVELNVSDNELFGEIPSDLGRCLGLQNLFLAGNSFQGPLPPSLSSLRGIQNLDLSRNNLSGIIPEYLENFTLNSLNLSFNDFVGKVPIKGVFGNSTAVSVTGNPRLCGGISELSLAKCNFKEVKKRKVSRAVLAVLIASALVVVTVSVYFLCHWLIKGRKERTPGLAVEESFLRVSFQDLLKATGGFSAANLIGTDSFGSVYKGILGETTVAVKVLDLQRHGASKSFVAECEALRNTRHRNLVKIITICSSTNFRGDEFKALVYEFMPLGNLDSWLSHDSEEDDVQAGSPSLDLRQRIDIAIDVASAMNYIHHECGTPIVHCDLKPRNILLDGDMIAHVGDFGLARSLTELPENATRTGSVGVRGTVGYAAPEYGIGNEPSTYGDVYSFGILLLEMVTRKRPTNSLFVEGLNLHNFVKMGLEDSCIMDIVDQTLIVANSEAPRKDLTASSSSSSSRIEKYVIWMAKVGVACSMEAPHDRMNMTQVVRELQSLKKLFLLEESMKIEVK